MYPIPVHTTMAVISGHLTALTASSGRWAMRGAWSALCLQPTFTWWSVSFSRLYIKLNSYKSSRKYLSPASMYDDNWNSNHFPNKPRHTDAAVQSASVEVVNHRGIIFKSLTVAATYESRHCASMCFMSDLSTPCHFYLIENTNCYLGNAFHTNGDILPTSPDNLKYKMNQSKRLHNYSPIRFGFAMRLTKNWTSKQIES